MTKTVKKTLSGCGEVRGLGDGGSGRGVGGGGRGSRDR